MCVFECNFAHRRAQDPGLAGVAAVVLDEFHERSVDGDLALSLCAACRAGPRPDLRRAAPMRRQTCDLNLQPGCGSVRRRWPEFGRAAPVYRAGVRPSRPV